MQDKIPYRQIHMDFHTNREIPAVGARFHAGEFVATLKAAHVNSINLFAKCHHGMYYYPTQIGTMHPTLTFDLFGEQIKACRENGLRAVAYTCVAWNEDWADRHPEWLCVTYDGLRGNKRPFETGYVKWNSLCINQPAYREIIKAELREIYERYRPAGYWVDLVVAYQCVCPVCQAEMKALHMDPTDRNQVIRHDRMAEIAFCKDIYGYIKSLDPGLAVYFNSHPAALDDGIDTAASSAEKRKYFDFIDIESLPSEEWGYNHFPVSSCYVGKYATETCMMNGKFHFSWADFGSLRNRAALEYECFRALAYGAKVCVGDQLHPSGRIDPVVYGRIGEVFASIEQKEPWLHATRRVCEVGVFIVEAAGDDFKNSNLPVEGVYQVLSELHIPFDFLNQQDPLEEYRLLILPDCFVPTEELAERLNKFVCRGGKVLATGRSGIVDGKFLLDFIQAEYVGESPFDTRYLRLDAAVFPAIPPIDHVLYEKGVVVRSAENALAKTVNPYFNRTYDRFCSHRQTPPCPDATEEPAIIKGQGYIYIASPLFSDYAGSRYQAHRDILRDCIHMLLDRPLLESDLPAISEVTVRKAEPFYVVHILNYVIQRRAKRLDTIEEVYTVPKATLRLRTGVPVAAVRLVPTGEEVAFSCEDGVVEVVLENLAGHTMLVFETR